MKALNTQNLKPLTKMDQLLDHLIRTTRCAKCKNDYPREMTDCPFCEENYAEGYASWKDYEESTDPDNKGVPTLNESITE